MHNLKQVLNKITDDYKTKNYSELEKIVKNVQCFDIVYNKKKYNFEVQAIMDKNKKLKIMIECSRSLLLISIFSKHRYFTITSAGEVEDIDGTEYWE